jgi:hypothetical protein
MYPSKKGAWVKYPSKGGTNHCNPAVITDWADPISLTFVTNFVGLRRGIALVELCHTALKALCARLFQHCPQVTVCRSWKNVCKTKEGAEAQTVGRIWCTIHR